MARRQLPFVFWVLFVGVCIAVATENTSSGQTPVFPTDPSQTPYFMPPNSKNSNIAVPSAPSYPYFENPYSTGTQYEDNSGLSDSSNSSFNSIGPVVKYFFTIFFRLASRLGVVLAGSVVILLIGGLFTTAVCTFTPLCTITFMGFGVQETMRSILTPNNVRAATALVKDTLNSFQNFEGKNSTLLSDL